MTSVNAFATLLEAFFNIFLQTHGHTHTHRHEDITWPLLRMRVQGNKTLSVEHLCYAHLIYHFTSMYMTPLTVQRFQVLATSSCKSENRAI